MEYRPPSQSDSIVGKELQHNKIRILDGLRGYAALMIVVAHIPALEGKAAKILKLIIGGSKIGYLGVDIFFVLSGFLITRILIREKLEGNFSFKNFYIKRSLRIFPIYYITIVVCCFLFTTQGMGYVAAYLSNYYFSYNLLPHPMRHSWSLAVEEQFYIVWPLMIYFFSLKTSEKIIKYIVPVFVLLMVIVAYRNGATLFAEALVYRGTQFRILSLSFGAIFAFLEIKMKNLSEKELKKVFVAFLFCYLLSLSVHLTPLVHLIPKPVLLFFLLSFASALFFLFILNNDHKNNFINALFVNRYIRFIGKVSYGIYLYHFPILYFFKITENQINGRLLMVSEIVLPFSLIFLIPVISFYLIETPFLKIKNNYFKSE